MRTFLICLALLLAANPVFAAPTTAMPVVSGHGVRLKDLARIDGVRDNALVGYGIVVGLSGTGDGSRSLPTLQSLSNILANFGVNVTAQQLASGNAAAVMVTATLPSFAQSGDKLDVHVSSMADAKSLSGGTLLLTPLYGPDHKLYALAQGSLSVGGYNFSAFGNDVQKNFPNVGYIPSGANVESAAPDAIPLATQHLTLVLNQPDFTTAERAAQALQARLSDASVMALDASRISITLPQMDRDPVALIAEIENVPVAPDQSARVVVNERTGTVVAGGDVSIGNVSISQGDLRVIVTTQYDVSQPSFLFLGRNAGNGINTAVVPNTQINVNDDNPSATVTLPDGTTVAELVGALRRVKLNTRDVISILQAIKSAGALHGELVIQ